MTVLELLRMRPDQLREAVRRRLPLLVPAGVVEYHGPHLPLGTDVLIPARLCEEIARREPCVVAPAFPFGPTLSWAGAASEGEMDFDPEPFFVYVRETLRRFVRMGFRRIYVMQYHQGEDGLQRLCVKRAAGEVVRELTGGFGEGWGRRDPDTLPMPDPFGLIRVAGLDDYAGRATDGGDRLPIGHAGKGETQLVMAAAPETVELGLLREAPDPPGPLPVWLSDASDADAEEGERWLAYCAAGWVDRLRSDAVAPRAAHDGGVGAADERNGAEKGVDARMEDQEAGGQSRIAKRKSDIDGGNL